MSNRGTVAIAGAHDGREAKPRRARALAQAEERFAAVAMRFQEAYSMPLPRHFLYAAAFFLGLSPDERTVCPVRLTGVVEWFLWLDPDVEPRIATSDPRLQGRHYRYPPELVTVASGGTPEDAGGHWGLYYDDPRSLPSLVVHSYGREADVVHPRKSTLLASLRPEVAKGRSLPSGTIPHKKVVVRAMTAWLDALCELEERGRAEEGVPEPVGPRIELAQGGLGVSLPGWRMPSDLPDPKARRRAYDDNAPDIQEWIARADAALARGDGELALVIGRELHFAALGGPEDCLRLLAGGYRALGRDALAEVARVHLAHRDQLATVNVYSPASLVTPIAVAVRDLDESAFEAALREPPALDALALAAGAITNLSGEATNLTLTMLERMLDLGGEPLASRVLGAHLKSIHRTLDTRTLMKAENAEVLQELGQVCDRRCTDLLLARGARFTTLREVAHAIETGQPDLVARALEAPVPLDGLVDLTSTRGMYATGGDVDGTLLHFAVCTTSAEIVGLVLARGLDPRAKDAAGQDARDLVRALLRVKPGEARRMLELFEARVPKVAVAAPLAAPGVLVPGARVVHKVFGSGVVESTEGAGDSAKVTVRFEGSAGAKKLVRSALTLAS